MAGRGFCLQIFFDLQAITCPGVWLCPNGTVALRVTTLGRSAESRRVSPVFPLFFHQQFTFKKVFTRVPLLTDLQRLLEQEILYAELIQWITPCNRGIILASFETNLIDLLYPVTCYKGLLAGVDVDLLMEPTKYFPGIIVPKIEVSTRTVIEEVLGVYDTSNGPAYVVNPKTINSKRAPCVQRRRPVKGIIRQRKVCHSQGKPRTEVCRPCHRASANSCDRSQAGRCYHGSRRNADYACDFDCKNNFEETHIFDNCPVCFKYKCYFSGEPETLAGRKESIPRRCTEQAYNDDYCCTVSEHDRCACDHTRQGFYRDLEMFYKRMYKQAKFRAQEANCNA